MTTYTWQRPAGVTDAHVLALYRAVGWAAYLKDPTATLAALIQSAILWAVADDGQLAGLIRGISDGYTILYIQDIIVAPPFQRQHIGTELVHRFLLHFQHVGQTVLLTDPEEKTKQFYQSLGFREVTPQAYGRAFVLDRRYPPAE